MDDTKAKYYQEYISELPQGNITYKKLMANLIHTINGLKMENNEVEL